MAIEVKCDCGLNYLAGIGTMTVEQTKKGPMVTCTCPNCEEKQMALAKPIKEKKEDKNGRKKR